MPKESSYVMVLAKEEREELIKRANKYTLPYFSVLRARMILLAAQGLSNDKITERLDTPPAKLSACGENVSLKNAS
jgi:hypothetical protein